MTDIPSFTLSPTGRGTGSEAARVRGGAPATSSPLTLTPSASVPLPRAGEGIVTDTSRLASANNLKAAGQKFEAVFTGMMLKSMRQAKLADPLFDSKALDTFTEMQDARVAQAMAEHQPLGIGRAMTEFLGRAQAALQAPETGPTTGNAG